MQKPNWQEFDFKVASDYSHGSPEYYRETLRKMIGMPTNLPGEKNDNQEPKPNTRNIGKVFNAGNMSSFLRKT
jgi:hypothetical protein